MAVPPNVIVALVPAPVVPVTETLRIVLPTPARVTFPALLAPPVAVLIVRSFPAALPLIEPPLNVTEPAAELLPVSVSIVMPLAAVMTVFPANVSVPPSA